MATTEAQQSAVDVGSLNGLHWVGIVAALVSAAVHLLLGVRMFPSPMGISFVLAGLGFVGGIVLLAIDYRRRTVYAVGIAFTLVQIVLWYVVNFAGGGKSFPADVGTLGAVDKVAQVVLIAVLVALLRR
jgi:succinate dehydrogenase/fumarate reductase cytochrome b subunit